MPGLEQNSTVRDKKPPQEGCEGGLSVPTKITGHIRKSISRDPHHMCLPRFQGIHVPTAWYVWELKQTPRRKGMPLLRGGQYWWGLQSPSSWKRQPVRKNSFQNFPEV